MRKKLSFENVSYERLRNFLIEESYLHDPFILLDSNSSTYKNKHLPYTEKYSLVCAIGSISDFEFRKGEIFENLNKYLNSNSDWVFGHLTYNLYSETEAVLEDKNPNHPFHPIYFFRPTFVVYLIGSQLTVEYNLDDKNDPFLKRIAEINVLEIKTLPKTIQPKILWQQSTPKEEYISNVLKIKHEIQLGNLYETNYCIDFSAYVNNFQPQKTYLGLSTVSPTPFSGFYKVNDDYLLCSSPERFLKRSMDTLLSQPIKGTLRSSQPINNLQESQKEIAENSMITDLVRNDLSKISIPGTVKVLEQNGVYTFGKVHQMISTIESKIDRKSEIGSILKAMFPMGSMTGAPKIKAIEISNRFEKNPRGIYSGSIGYIEPGGDFDFNVIIRSLVYNQSKNLLSFHVGSAITSKSDAMNEYSECLLKAEGMLEALNSNL